MTENEVKKTIDELLFIKVGLRMFPERLGCIDTAIQALAEIQSYRELENKLNGISVEQVVNAFIEEVEKKTNEGYERGRILTNKEADDWNAYRAIGTVEEFKALKEKNEPKKVFQPFGTHSYKCSNCWKFVAHEVDDNCDLESEMAEWCPYCGQKLDWQ